MDNTAEIEALMAEITQLSSLLEAKREALKSALTLHRMKKMSEEDPLAFVASRQKKLSSDERKVLAFKLRANGMIFKDIGKALGVSPARARDIVLRGEKILGKSRPKEPRTYTEVEMLELSSRSLHCLVNSGITTIGQLRAMSDDDLLSIPNLGRKSFYEIREVLASVAT